MIEKRESYEAGKLLIRYEKKKKKDEVNKRRKGWRYERYLKKKIKKKDEKKD